MEKVLFLSFHHRICEQNPAPSTFQRTRRWGLERYQLTTLIRRFARLYLCCMFPMKTDFTTLCRNVRVRGTHKHKGDASGHLGSATCVNHKLSNCQIVQVVLKLCSLLASHGGGGHTHRLLIGPRDFLATRTEPLQSRQLSDLLFQSSSTSYIAIRSGPDKLLTTHLGVYHHDSWKANYSWG